MLALIWGVHLIALTLLWRQRSQGGVVFCFLDPALLMADGSDEMVGVLRDGSWYEAPFVAG